MTVTHTTRALSRDEAITGTFFSTGLAFQLNLTDADGHTVSQTQVPFTVTIDYSENGLGPLFALSAAVYRYEEGRWEPQPSVVDPVNQTLTAKLRRTGVYSILGDHWQQLFLPFAQSPH